ncbi:MAG: 7-cyano-7-deazaguanine synthase [Dehalococcoidia bacterium]|nr:7-cyano-7-deazaguanine synthase [Dehalococcoidia bacterium]
MGNSFKLRDLQRRGMIEKVAILASGGLDSSVLIADYARSSQVFPIYIQGGLSWETMELKALRSFLAAICNPNVEQITVLQMPAGPLYSDHWSMTGQGVPRADEPGRNVYIPGRNILLICPTAVWCSIQGIHRIALASLNENNFADAMPEFFQSLASALSTGLEHEIRLESPYSGLSKWELIAKYSGLPLHLTLTCMVPVGGKHCGKCNKCHERHSAFVKAAIQDQTPYAAVPK